MTTSVKRTESSDQLRAFWTPDKIRSARPIPLPSYALSRAQQESLTLPQRTTAKRRHAVSTQNAVPAISGFPIPNAGTYPYSMIGKILATFPDGSPVFGTGILISESFVLTAAHCLYNPAKNTQLYENIAFVPGSPQESQVFAVSEAWLPSPRMQTIDPSVDYAVINIYEPLYTGPFASIFFGQPFQVHAAAFGYSDNAHLFVSPGFSFMPDGSPFAVFTPEQNSVGGGGGPWMPSSLLPPPFAPPQPVTVGLNSSVIQGNASIVAGPIFGANFSIFLKDIGYQY